MMANTNCIVTPHGPSVFPALFGLNVVNILGGRIYYYYLIEENIESKGHLAKR